MASAPFALLAGGTTAATKIIGYSTFSQRPYYMLLGIQRWLNLMLDLIVAAEAVIVVGLAVGLRHSTSPGLLGISMNNILCKYLFTHALLRTREAKSS